jgi:hypothetical protein
MPDGTQSEHIKPSANNDFPGLTFWTESYKAALAGWARSGDGVLKQAAAFSDDIFNFSRTQFEADLTLWQAAISCRNASDLLAWQQQFANTRGTQYLNQAQKLTSRIVTLVAEAAVAPLREQTQRSVR